MIGVVDDDPKSIQSRQFNRQQHAIERHSSSTSHIIGNCLGAFYIVSRKRGQLYIFRCPRMDTFPKLLFYNPRLPLLHHFCCKNGVATLKCTRRNKPRSVVSATGCALGQCAPVFGIQVNLNAALCFVRPMMKQTAPPSWPRFFASRPSRHHRVLFCHYRYISSLICEHVHEIL